MSNKTRPKTVYKNMCNDCGTRLYEVKREHKGLTSSYENCPLCSKFKLIIPAIDWEWMTK